MVRLDGAGPRPLRATGRGWVAASHAVLRDGESLTSARAGELPQNTPVAVERVSGGRVQLSAPHWAAGKWTSAVARSGHVVIAAADCGEASDNDAASGPAAVEADTERSGPAPTQRASPAAPYPACAPVERAAAALQELENDAQPGGGWFAVLVRTHRPSEAALGRIAEWAAECAAAPGWQLWVQADVSPCGKSRPPAESLLGRLHRAARGRVHAYTEDQMAEAFPALRDAPWPRTPSQSLAYGFHCEAVALWWREHGRGCAAVWVLEDDVGCSGPLLSVLSQYPAAAGDLVTVRWVQRHPGWAWRKAASPGFQEACPRLSDQLFSREHVQRWSARLLTALDALSRGGVVAWSEMATPSLCRRMGLIEGCLLPAHVGVQFDWKSRLRRDEWPQLCAADAAEGRPRLYHALKW
eukprot:TRINITY_DN65663_c0_g1_i1.p1 TRINITY_DN65663_c0_g1~~TRINITY_DN65663_c0_g1_i1.p1  ORF type:complete len:412 (+),score=87.19 TRINITY_DN65663_c0_g1_i1:67-1302(+)